MQYKEISADEYDKMTDLIGNHKVLFPDGAKAWYQNGKLHRTDGPADIYLEGEKFWFLFGTNYSVEEWFEQLTKEQLTIALANPENF